MAVTVAGSMSGCGDLGEPPAVDGYEISGGPDYPLFDHSLTSTGSHVVVVGGAGGDMDDGLLVDEPMMWSPTDGVQAIASPPGEPRNRHTAVWTGDELVVWSGTTEPYGVGDGLLISAAAYDPATDTWRQLADSPEPVARVRGRGTTFDGFVIVTGGTTPNAAHEGTIGIYELETNTWSTTQVPGDGLTAVATSNAAYVLWLDNGRAVRLSRLDPTTSSVTDVELPVAPSGAAQSNAVVADDRLIVWVEATDEGSAGGGASDDAAVTALVLDDDSTLAADPTAAVTWRQFDVAVRYPGSASRLGDVRPLLHTDEWLAFTEGSELVWIRIADGLDVRRSLTLEQSCAVNTEAVGTPEFIVAWGGNCTLVDDDGSEEQIIGHFVFTPPTLDE